jgi:hypothetical protein
LFSRQRLGCEVSKKAVPVHFNTRDLHRRFEPIRDCFSVHEASFSPEWALPVARGAFANDAGCYGNGGQLEGAGVFGADSVVVWLPEWNTAA